MRKYLYLTGLLLVLTGMMPVLKKYVFKVDTGKSEIYWKCDKHHGYVPLKSGRLTIDDQGNITGIFYLDLSLLQVKDLDTDEYRTAKGILENTLKNEFFEIDKYPDAYFRLKDVQYIQDDTYRFTGDLTMHGITVCVSFKGKLYFKKGHLYLDSEKFVIDRTAWGIYRLSPKHPYPDDEHGWTVKDSVDIRVHLVMDKISLK